nr:PREDICTED: protein phosphatase 1 regulatory subunit 3B [Bemisia tabaci]
MCSVAMPTDFEMRVGHSPSASGFFPGLAPWPRSYFPRQTHSQAQRLSRPAQPTPLGLIGKSFSAPPPAPRPCLVTRQSSSDDSGSSSDENDAPSPTRLKKKVVFADDRGLSLTQVRLMTESPAQRGYWRSRTLDFIPSSPPTGPKSSSPTSTDSWEITFSQPASDYVSFRKRLDTCNVSLENVIVKDQEISGTIKVKNLSFKKDVFVRSTTDNWLTYQDTHATFINNTVNSAVQVLYDTFNFKLALPPVANVVELCVCYQYDSTEHWDNNNGQNYVIKRKIVEKPFIFKPEPSPAQPQPKRYTDAVRAKLDTWSEFASWNHLVNEGPYW